METFDKICYDLKTNHHFVFTGSGNITGIGNMLVKFWKLDDNYRKIILYEILLWF